MQVANPYDGKGEAQEQAFLHGYGAGGPFDNPYASDGEEAQLYEIWTEGYEAQANGVTMTKKSNSKKKAKKSTKFTATKEGLVPAKEEPVELGEPDKVTPQMLPLGEVSTEALQVELLSRKAGELKLLLQHEAELKAQLAEVANEISKLQILFGKWSG